jgi:alpha/beta superfamily hydrolase
MNPSVDAMQNLTIDGPVGPLQACFQIPENAPTDGPAALLAHPHPQMGGTMHDAVLDTLASALLARGISCLRFNFRGAGASAGTFDGGDGECEDLTAALRWLVDETGSSVWLAGYSFGSWIGWRVAATAPVIIARIIMIAPPIGMLHYADRNDPRVPVQIFHGGSDDFVNATTLREWAERNATETPVEIAGADHFFRGHSPALRDALDAALA